MSDEYRNLFQKYKETRSSYFDWVVLSDEEIERLDREAWAAIGPTDVLGMSYEEFKSSRNQWRCNLGIV